MKSVTVLISLFLLLTHAVRAGERIASPANSTQGHNLCRKPAKSAPTAQDVTKGPSIEEMQKQLQEALRAGLAAKTMEELDGPIEIADALVNKFRFLPPGDQPLHELSFEAEAVLNLLKFLQNYQAGFKNPGRGSLDVAVAMPGWDFSKLIPRSQFLLGLAAFEKANANHPIIWSPVQEFHERVREILHEIHTLPDMAGALVKLEGLTIQSDTVLLKGNDSAEYQNIRKFQQFYLSVNEGMATAGGFRNYVGTGPMFSQEQALYALRSQLFVYTVPRILGVEDTDAPQSEKDIPDYLLRIAALARKKADWDLLRRTIEVATAMDFGTDSWWTDRSALEDFLPALNQERARQYALAVSSYQAALKTGSREIPADFIGVRLEAIRKDHPQEYQEGMQLVQKPGPRPAPPKAVGTPFPQASTPSPANPK